MLQRAHALVFAVIVAIGFVSVTTAQVAPQPTAPAEQVVPAPAIPKTLAEANALNTADGWTAAKLADGRPVALYRDASVTPPKQIALGGRINSLR